MFRYLIKLLRYNKYIINFFNNTLSPRINLPYYCYWVIAKQKYRMLTNKQFSIGVCNPKLNLSENDFVLVKGVLREGKAKKWSQSLTRLVDSKPEEFEKSLEYHLRLKNPLQKLDFELSEIFGNKNLQDEIISVLSCPFQVAWIDCYRTIPVEVHSRENSWLWHSDNTPVGTLKCMIALTDITLENGAMSYLSRKATNTIRRGKNYFGDVSSARIETIDESSENSLLLEASAGDVILFDNNNLHRANVPKNKHRDVMTCLIIPRIPDKTNFQDRGFAASKDVDALPGPYPSLPWYA